MKISLIHTGRTTEKYLQEGFSIYEKRIKRYISFETIIIPDLKNVKNLDAAHVKGKEADIQLNYIKNCDYLVLLDEWGKEMRSTAFANFLQLRMNSSIKNLLFLTGGPYGFADCIHAKANQEISLSKMTFSHQLVRLLFVEQLYRAFSIIHHEPYHHEG
ncbi:MAG: 23S rRNA (pseudouridine(1915)-N(3))-methyltransferase RlmH [Bacteroidales bacterium]|jgi:23S rRNA (pseudouridine1915-N3)-methyltransferase